MGEPTVGLQSIRMTSSRYLFNCLLMMLLATLSFLRMAEASESFQVLVNQGRNEPIRLKSFNQIQPGTIVSLPIEIDEAKISLNGKRPPRLKAITSENMTVSYFGIGDAVHVNLEYYSEVYVTGKPSITLNTGCRSKTCMQPEIQSFSCVADQGMFSMRLEDQFIMNLDVNTTAIELKKKLQELVGIDEVSVDIASNNTNLIYRDQLCSGTGNNITITFNRTTFPQYNGDVPPIYLNPINDDPHLVSGFAQGVESFLKRSSQANKVLLPSVTTEVVKGRNQTDGLAYYGYGNETSKITFIYTVKKGDTVDSLDVISINFDYQGYITSKYGQNVSTAVPFFGIGSRYLSSSPSSLSYAQPITVSSAIPKVISLNSPNASDTYTAGDVLFIDVIFDLAFSLRNPELFGLELASGVFTRQVPFHSLLTETPGLRFIYAVQENDASSALDVTTAEALYLNGGKIFLGSENTVTGEVNEVDAVIILPDPGFENSLSVNKQLVINTMSPVVISLTTIPVAGNYTAGDLLNFDVLYNTRITVTGSPRFPLVNIPRSLDVSIRTAPHLPSFSYVRSFPGGITQIIMKVQCNWDLYEGDVFELYLPQLNIRETDYDKETSLNNRVSSITVHGDYSFTGYWNETAKVLTMTSESSKIPGYSMMELLIESQTGLFISSEGLVPKSTGMIERLSMNSDGVNAAYTQGFSFQQIECVGIKNMSLTVEPMTFIRLPYIVFDIEVPELLVAKDTISLYLPNFYNSSVDSDLIAFSTADGSEFAYQWQGNSSQIMFTLLSTMASSKHFTFNLTSLFYEINIPDDGLSSEHVAISMNSEKNGQLSMVAIPYVTKICTAPTNGTVAIKYEYPNPGSESAVTFEWNTGYYPLSTGDTIIFTLSHLSNLYSGNLSYFAIREQFAKDHFQIRVIDNEIVFKVLVDIPARMAISVTLEKSVGITVPSNGILSNRGDYFTFWVKSQHCGMLSPRQIPYSSFSQVIYVDDPYVTLTPDNSSFGALTAVDIAFTLVGHGLSKGDRIDVTLNKFPKRYVGSLNDETMIESNANISTIYSPLKDRLTFTLLEDFDLDSGTSSKSLYFKLARNASFSIPDHGIPENAAMLSIKSQNYGNLKEDTLSISCMGFCSGSIDYSTLITNSDLTMDVTFEYGDSIPSGSIFTFYGRGMIVPDSSDLSLSIMVGGSEVSSSYYTYSLFGDDNHRVNITSNGINIASGSTIVLTFTGFQLTTDSLSLSPKISFVDSRYYGEAWYDFAIPSKIYEFPSMDSSIFEFDTTTRTSFTWTFDLESGVVIPDNSMLMLKLPGFSSLSTVTSMFKDNSMLGYVEDSNGILDESKCFYNETAGMMKFYVNRTVLDDEQVVIKVNGINPPISGIETDSTSIVYALAFGSSSDAMTTWTTFSSVVKYVTIFNTSMEFEFYPNSIKHLTTLTITIDMTNGFTAGDIIYISNLDSIQARGSNEGLNVSLTCSSVSGGGLCDEMVNGTWWDDQNSLVMKILSSTSDTLEVTFNVSMDGIYLADEGIAANTLFDITVFDSNFDYVANFTDSLPCVGICSIVMEPIASTPSRATAYNLDIRLRGFGMLPGDYIDVILPDFSGVTGNSMKRKNISCTNMFDEDLGIFQFTWYAENTNVTVLKVLYPTEQNYTTEVFSLKCHLPQDMNIVLPKDGIRSGERFLANMTYHLNEFNDYFASDVVMFPNVGSSILSSIIIEPALANAAVALEFIFSFEDDLQEGDEINIYLPNFVAPTRPLPFTMINLNDDDSIFEDTPIVVMSTSAVSKANRNVDNTLFYDRMISYLTITLQQNLAAGKKLAFRFENSVGITSPVEGVFNRPLPWFSVVSNTSPIAGSTFANVTRFGTLNPSKYGMNTYNKKHQGKTSNNESLSYLLLDLEFTVSCPIFQNDSIVISVPQIMPMNLTDADANLIGISLNSWNTSSTLSLAVSTFTIEYFGANDSMVITMDTGYILSGKLYFQILLSGFEFTNTVVYENDPRITYDLISDTCPVNDEQFSSTTYHLVKSSQMKILPVDSLNGNNAISFDMMPMIELLDNDMILIILDNVTFNSTSSGRCTFGELCSIPLKSSLPGHALQRHVYLNVSADSVIIIMIVENNIVPAKQIQFSTFSNSTDGFIFVNDAINTMIRAQVRIIRGENPSEVMLSGEILDMETIPFLTASSIEIDNPMAGVNSGLTLSWTMSSELNDLNKMEFILPGFSLHPKATSTWSYCSEDSVQQFFVTFTADNFSLSLVPKIPIPGKTPISVTIPASQGLINSLEGLPNKGRGVSVYLWNKGRKIFHQDVESCTVVPYLPISSLSFLSSDAVDAFVYGGDVHALQLEPGHELSEGDAGDLIEIDGDLYTIDHYAENVLYLVEQYQGRRVFLGYPEVEVASSPYRYATYLSGSNSYNLIFQYKVARGDLGYGLQLHAQSASTYRIELNGGKLLRASQSPVIVASLSLPSILSGDQRYVDTYIPTITEIYTTSAPGVYGEGQYVDIIVVFTDNVVIYPPKEEAHPPARILLNLQSSGIQYAEYYNGSGTNEIVFLYKVKNYDYEVNISQQMIMEKEAEDESTSYDLPFYQPLRFIVGDQFGYLRRKSDIPLLDADLDLSNATFSFDSNPQFIGNAPIVTELKLFRNEHKILFGQDLEVYMSSKTYSAGDYIEFSVHYSIPIEVKVPADNSSRPYIELNVGRDVPGIAYYERPMGRNALLFSYLVTIEDKLPDGLLLFCTCEDYLQRTFIHLNGSILRSKENDITASLLIANSPRLYSLQIDSEVQIDNEVPRVISVNSNVSAGIYAPGDSIVVNVRYSAPVYVIGIVTLHLQGQDSSCRAPFYDGNGTYSLNFIYHVSSRSGVSKLDCSSASGLDTSLGTIYRTADVPTIIANNSLPLPGSQIALGRQEFIVIDTADGHIEDIQLQLHLPDTFDVSSLDHVNFLATQSLSFNYLQGLTLDELYAMCGCDAWLQDGEFTPSRLEEMIATRSDILSNLNVTSLSELPDYIRFTVVERYLHALDALPVELSRCFNWWRSYQVDRHIDFLVEFNRPVVQEGVYVNINTGSMINQARSLPTYKHYQLLAMQPQSEWVSDGNGTFTDSGSLDRFFAIRYNGQISPCISLTTNVKGEDSFLDHLLAITQLRQFLPSVSKTYLEPTVVQLDIDFIKALDYPLELLYGDNVLQICPYPASGSDIMLVSESNMMTLRYEIQHEDALIVTSKERIPAGSYSMTIKGPKLSKYQEIIADSFVVKHLSPNQVVRSYSSANNNPIARITRSSLILSTNYPGNISQIHVEICVSTSFEAGDVITVHLPYFNDRTSSMTTPSTTDYSAEWDSSNSALIFTMLSTASDISCLKTPSGLNAYNLTLPSRAIYLNDQTYSFSTNSSTVGNLNHVHFQYVKPIGIADISLALSDPRPYCSTKLLVHLELLMDLQPGNETLQLYLPGFFSIDSVRADINIEGFLGEHMNGRWWNQTATMYLTPYRRIPAGVYDFVIASDKFALFTPPAGIDSTNPPGVVVKDPFWQLDVTPMVSYPIIYGYDSIWAEISVNSSYALSSLSVEILVSRTIKGPAVFAITIPSLSHKYGYFAAFNDSLLFDEATWYDFNKTWVIRRNAGWEYTGSPLTFTMKNVTDFYVNERGINTHFGPDNETTISLYATDGYLPPIAFNFEVGVPMIRNATVQLVQLQNDIFYAGKENLILDFDINRPPQFDDSFYVKFEGGLQFNFSTAKSDDFCFYIKGFTSSNNASILEIGMSNASWILCKYHLMYHMHISISNIVVEQGSKLIRQYDVPYVSMAWTNNELASDYRYVTRPPLLGLYMSSLTFSNPYAGQTTGIELKISTATNLQKGDLIQLELKNFACNFTSSSANVQSMNVQDSHGLEWSWKCSIKRISSYITSAIVSMTVPINLPPSALHFDLLNERVLYLPTSNGLSFYDRKDEVKIRFQRKDKMIHSQDIAVVTPIGFIEDLDVHIFRKSTFCQSTLCEVVNEFGMEIALTTLSRLSAGNVINITFDSVVFEFPAVLPLTEDVKGMLEVRTVATNMISIIIFERQYSEDLLITILPSSSMDIQLNNAFSSDVEIDMDSFTSPIENAEGSFQLFILEDPIMNFVLDVNTSEAYINDAGFNSEKVMEIELLFKLRHPLSVNDEIHLYLPSFLNISDESASSSIDFVVKDASAGSWDIQLGNNDSLILSVAQNMSIASEALGQDVLILLATDRLSLKDGLIYENTKVAFEIVDNDKANYTMDSSFFSVVPLGLAHSAISFRNPVVDSISPIDISVVAVSSFNASEYLMISLPGFTNSAGSSINATVSPQSCDLEWDSDAEILYVDIKRETTSVEISLFDFQLPTLGVNTFNGTIPTVSYNQTVKRNSWFGPAQFASLQYVSPIIYVNITFELNTAGSWSTLDIILTSDMIVFDANDQIEIFLPQFYSNTDEIDVTSSFGKFTAKWNGCQETLVLTVMESFKNPVERLSWSISSLILPPKGVTDALASVLRLESNSRVSGKQIFVIEGVERIGYVDDSKIWFSPAYVNISSPDLIVDFLLSFPIVEDDVITLMLPGIIVSETCTLVSNLSIPFDIVANIPDQTITLTSRYHWAAMRWISLNISSCLTIPIEGFPMVEFNDFSYFIAATLAAGNIGETEIKQIYPVGVENAHVQYIIPDTSKPMSLQFNLEFTADLSVGDVIAIYLPFADAQQDLNNLTLRGDLASEDYRSHFNGRFDQESSTIFFECLEAISLRPFTIFVDAQSDDLLDKSIMLSMNQNRNVSHYLSANISSIGNIVQRWIPYSPTNIGLVRDPAITVTTCNGTLFCEFELSFTLVDDLEVGNHLLFSHEQLRLPAFSSLNFTTASTSDAEKFELFWRSSDQQEGVAVRHHELFLEPELNGRLWVSSNMQTLSVEKSLANFIESSNYQGVSIVTQVPRVKSLRIIGDYDSYFCGEEVDIILTMDNPVFVADSIKVKLLLNTGEYAAMIKQLDSAQLLFRYFIKNPRNGSVDTLAVAGAGALELLSFDQIVDAFNAHIVANLTIDAPFELRRPSLDNGYLETVSITCDNTAVVTRVYAYSGEKVWYSHGDVLDVNVVFNRPIVVTGVPQLFLSEMTSGTNMVAEYVDVSRIQYLHVAFSDMQYQFSLLYHGETTGCLLANDTQGIAEALKGLTSLESSLPLHIEKLANTGNEYEYVLTFFGVSPELLIADSILCEDRTTVHIHKDAKLLNEVTFRYNVSFIDPSGNISQANSSALQLVQGSNIWVKDNFIKKTADITLPDESEGNSLYGSSAVWINNEEPYILNVTSNFQDLYGRKAKNGDNITIEVIMSAPMVSNGSVLLPLALDNFLNNSQATVFASLMFIQDNVLTFSYYVNLGDYSELLDVAFTPTSLVIADEQSGSYLRRQSRIPFINASLTLPYPGATNGLSMSNVAVNATDLPVIMRAYVSPIDWKVTAGSTVVINIEFSSTVFITRTSLDLQPRIDFVNPPGATMYYLEGSGSTTLQFSYEVKSEHATGNVSFVFILEHAYATDLLGHNFANLTDQLVVVDNFGVDTHAPTAVKVDCNCEDSIYYPGQVLDIFILFDKEVYILNSTDTINPIELELFILTQEDQQLLAQYAYGNGTRSLHFLFTIPEPNKFSLPQIPQNIDYAGTAALEKHLKYAFLTDVSPIPTTRANVFLPTLDISYLAYQRKVLIDFNNAKVERVFALRNGTYTVGDKLTVVVQFTTSVMFFNPAPYFMLTMGDHDKIAKYVRGNNTKMLYFEYTIEEGDSTKRLDYVDTRNLPYDTSSSIRSYPLISFDNYESKFFDTPIVGLYMSSNVSNIHVECSFPLLGMKGSLAASSSVVVDTTRPVVVSVQAMIPSGTYGSLTYIPILVEFNNPVVVGGCPYIIFIVNRVKRYATYVSGSGGKFLYFNYTVLFNEYSFSFDYWDSYSLRNQACTDDHDGVVFINRLSDKPTLPADLKLPRPGQATSDELATSILSSGKNITLSGGSNRPIQINTDLLANKSYSFGDVIDVTLHFTGDFTVTDPLVVFELLNLPSNQFYGKAFAVNQSSSNELRFEYLIGPYETNEHVSYNGTYAMYSVIRTSCLFVDATTQRCMQQSLPEVNQVDGFGQDYFTGKNIKVVPMTEAVEITKIRFVSSNGVLQNNSTTKTSVSIPYQTGDRVIVEIEFSQAVSVTGEPVIFLQLNDNAQHLKAQYYRQVSARTIQFAYLVGRESIHGKVACGKGCMIYFEQGAIRKRNNFLSITHVNVAIPEKRHCFNEECDVIQTSILEVIPQVNRVYSNSTGVITNGETISIFIEFSCPVRHEGEVWLVLDLLNNPMAEMVGYMEGNTIMHFHHRVTETDYTSALDYKNTSSLIVRSSSHASTGVQENPGIYFTTKEITIPADLTLPLRGSESSLGRQSQVIIDQTRPNVIKVYPIPADYTTCGDYMQIVVEYSQPMKAIRIDPRVSMKNNTLSLFLKPTNISLPIRYLNASLVKVDGAKVIFQYYISAKLPVGVISVFSRSPIQLNGWQLVSKLNGITGPDMWDDSFLYEINLPVVRGTPVVQRVYSYNSSTTETYSAGDVLLIYVEMSTGVRVKNEQATLDLYVTGRIQEAVYAGMTADNKAIIFAYEVQGGDATDSLEYSGEYAFHGEVNQISSCEVPVPALMTLPPAYSEHSLATCCRIALASETVFIESVFPIKVAGSYGENEDILIVVRFSDKVVVQGEPYLLLDVGNGNVGRANYTTLQELQSSSEYDDLSVAFSAKDVVFKYMVQETDEIDSLVHAGVDALKIPKGSSILQYSNNPIFYVDPTLREPHDFSIVNGRVDRQWKYRFPQKVEVLLRDLYHNDANSLTLTVEHRGKTGTIFSSKKDDHLGSIAKDNLFFATGSGNKGNNYLEGSTTSMFSQSYQQAQGKGTPQDLFFSDSNLVNIASKGLANQSTTLNAASAAIDKEYSPLIGDGFVSQTIREQNPWWTLTMPSTEDVVVQTIRIYERKPEQWITPIVDLIIKGLDRYPVGHFQLNFTYIDPKNDSSFALTDYIPFRASAQEVKAAISAIFIIGNVEVEQSQLALCDMGCGNGVDQGLGDKYQLTFTSILVKEPVVSVTNIRYPGENLYGPTPIGKEIQRYPIVWYARTTRTGKYITLTKESVGGNEWLTPFYVMIFSKESTRTPNDTTLTIPTGLNESIAKSFFYYRFDSIDTVVTIQLPRPIHDVYGIKIQREGFGVLCLTEVEVYAEAVNNFAFYKRGSPVQSFDLMNPYTPEMPFARLFNTLPYDGRWFFDLAQDKESTGFGQLSEIVVVITDMAGIVHAYYQEISSLVTTLPRYGRLFSTSSGSYLSYPASWQDTFGLVAAEQIKPKIDQMRPLGYCRGKITEVGRQGEGEGVCEWQEEGLMSATPEIGFRLSGDIPYQLPLRQERVLYYVPDAFFTGYDFFTYQAYDRITVSSEVTVNLLIQPCRQYFNYSVGFFNKSSSALLCDCMPSATSILGDDLEQCEISRAKLCSQSSLRSPFLSMCSACYATETKLYDFVNQTLLMENVNDELVESTACRSETIRAVSILRLRGICLNSVELKDHGDSQTLSVASRAVSDESLVCLKTQDAITSSNTMKANFVPFQASLFTRTRP